MERGREGEEEEMKEGGDETTTNERKEGGREWRTTRVEELCGRGELKNEDTDTLNSHTVW